MGVKWAWSCKSFQNRVVSSIGPPLSQNPGFAPACGLTFSHTSVRYYALTWCGTGMLLTLWKPRLNLSVEKEYKDVWWLEQSFQVTGKDFFQIELFKFLSNVLLGSFSQEDKQLVVTDNESAVSKPLLQNSASLSPCSWFLYVAPCNPCSTQWSSENSDTYVQWIQM